MEEMVLKCVIWVKCRTAMLINTCNYRPFAFEHETYRHVVFHSKHITDTRKYIILERILQMFRKFKTINMVSTRWHSLSQLKDSGRLDNPI